jgi:hypothetical protein
MKLVWYRLLSVAVALALVGMLVVLLLPKPAYAAPVSFRAVASATVTTGTSLTINKPTGTVEGDVMVAAIAARDTPPNITGPSGWTEIRSDATSSSPYSRMSFFWKAAGASEPSSYTWTFSASVSGAAGGILTFSGVDITSPVDVHGGQEVTGSLTDFPAPSVNTTVANAMVVTAHTVPSSGTAGSAWTPPTGMTEVVDASSASGTGGESIEINYVAQATAGATGTKTAMVAGNDNAFGATQTVALKPRQWYNAGWKYRRAITLSPATSVANYQVQVTLTTAIMGNPYSNVNTDGSDIRFTGSDGTTLQDYWIESWSNTGTSTIWVEVATSGTSTIYMYYGNAAASSASSGDNTFLFFDDFPGTSLDTTTKWDSFTGTGGSIAVSGSSVRLDRAEIVTKTFQITDGIIEHRGYSTAKEISMIARASIKVYEVFGQTGTQGGHGYYQDGTVPSWAHAITKADVIQASVVSAITTSTWYKYRYILNGVNLQFVRFDDSWGQEATISYTDTGGLTTGYLGLRVYGSGFGDRIAYYDWIRVRKYVATEPTTTVVSEEKNWESYSSKDTYPDGWTQSDSFSDSTNHAYMRGEGFPSGTTKVGYYDGGDTLRETDTYSDWGGGTLDWSECSFPDYEGVAAEGWWHAVVLLQADNLPNTYSDAIADGDYIIDDDFDVDSTAIPEFPAVIAAIVVAGLCFGIYCWMRKKKLSYVKA